MSRIETEFILSDEFVDDVNYMLDFIVDWPWNSFRDIRYSFKKDIDNQLRKVTFLDFGDNEWGVRLRSPDSKGLGAFRDYTDEAEIVWFVDDDRPGICQEHGCVKGCPRKVSFEERKAALKNFRERQGKKSPWTSWLTRRPLTMKTC